MTMAKTTKKKAPAKRPAKSKKPAAKKKAAPKRPAKPKAAAPTAPRATKQRDPRLPAAGSVIEKTYKGKALKVEVRETDFRFDGKDWSSLTAIAMAVTGAKSINGPLFFGIAKRATKTTREGK
jgi:hypothetical protein